MGLGHLFTLLGGMLLLALLIEPMWQRWRLPFPALLVLLGFLLSELIVALGLDTGVRHDNFHDLILFVFLPVLVFEAALRIDATLLWRNLALILFLAIPVMLLSTLVTAVMVYHGIGHPGGFPWIAALLTGALLSATDPSAVSALLERLGIPKRLSVLIEGESLFNDASAIVTFSIFLYLATHPAEDISLADAGIRFMLVFGGGLLVGLATGLIALLLSRLLHDYLKQTLLSLIAAYAAYLVAEQLLQVSGVMAVLVTGLIVGRIVRNDFVAEQGWFIQQSWGLLAYLAAGLTFLLTGISIGLPMFQERWLAMIIGIAAILIARAVGVFTLIPLLAAFSKDGPIPLSQQRVIYLAGLRGAVTLALALSLPTSLDYWWTIQSIAFGVVLFTLFVQAPYMEPLLKRGDLRR